MKNAILIAIFTIVLATGQSAMAQDSYGKLSIGANVSFFDIASTGKDINIQFDSTAFYGVNLTYYFDKNFSGELSVGYSRSDVFGTGSGTTFSAGEFEQFPVLLTARYHLPMISGKISPYFGGGGGYYFNNFTASRIVTLAGGKMDTDNSFAFHLNSGIEFLIREDMVIGLDFKYIWNEADGAFTMVGLSARDDLDLNTLLVGISFKVILDSD